MPEPSPSLSAETAADRAGEGFAVAPWPGDKRWAYSITFDEALSDLHRFAVPILEAHGVPGHLEVVVGQMGEARQIGQSSYNGFKHMGRDELREMLARGWGVGNHSWTHGPVNAETAAQELGQAKEVLEETLGEPVTIYCSPGDNSNMNDAALAACRRLGYLGAMSITDALNWPDDADPLWINRTFLHTQGYAPFYSAFDPFRLIQHARRDRGWVVDYLHCPLERAVHPNKDCSAAELRERIETVCAEGGGEVWLARVEDAVDYRYTRRATRIEPMPGGAGEYRVHAEGLPPAVRRRTVTLRLPASARGVQIDGQPATLTPSADRAARLVELDLSRERRVRVVS